jgi:hypothetical protein
MSRTPGAHDPAYGQIRGKGRFSAAWAAVTAADDTQYVVAGVNVPGRPTGEIGAALAPERGV